MFVYAFETNVFDILDIDTGEPYTRVHIVIPCRPIQLRLKSKTSYVFCYLKHIWTIVKVIKRMQRCCKFSIIYSSKKVKDHYCVAVF